MTADGEPLAATNGFLSQQAVDTANSGAPQVVFVCGGPGVAKHVSQSTITLLRQMARDGVVLGGLGSGTLALAKAGLLDGSRCTIHWENLACLRESYRDIEFFEELFVIDRDRITCAGGMASIDMMLALVKARFGRALVGEISDQLILERVRDSRDRQRVPLSARSGLNPVLAKVVALMEQNLEQPLSTKEIASSLNVSICHLQRIFHSSLETTVTAYYRHLRLRHGRNLILQSQLQITEIAVCCGYRSPGRFSKKNIALF